MIRASSLEMSASSMLTDLFSVGAGEAPVLDVAEGSGFLETFGSQLKQLLVDWGCDPDEVARLEGPDLMERFVALMPDQSAVAADPRALDGEPCAEGLAESVAPFSLAPVLLEQLARGSAAFGETTAGPVQTPIGSEAGQAVAEDRIASADLQKLLSQPLVQQLAQTWVSERAGILSDATSGGDGAASPESLREQSALAWLQKALSQTRLQQPMETSAGLAQAETLNEATQMGPLEEGLSLAVLQRLLSPALLRQLTQAPSVSTEAAVATQGATPTAAPSAGSAGEETASIALQKALAPALVQQLLRTHAVLGQTGAGAQVSTEIDGPPNADLATVALEGEDSPAAALQKLISPALLRQLLQVPWTAGQPADPVQGSTVTSGSPLVSAGAATAGEKTPWPALQGLLSSVLVGQTSQPSAVSGERVETAKPGTETAGAWLGSAMESSDEEANLVRLQKLLSPALLRQLLQVPWTAGQPADPVQGSQPASAGAATGGEKTPWPALQSLVSAVLLRQSAPPSAVSGERVETAKAGAETAGAWVGSAMESSDGESNLARLQKLLSPALLRQLLQTPLEASGQMPAMTETAEADGLARAWEELSSALQRKSVLQVPTGQGSQAPVLPISADVSGTKQGQSVAVLEEALGRAERQGVGGAGASEPSASDPDHGRGLLMAGVSRAGASAGQVQTGAAPTGVLDLEALLKPGGETRLADQVRWVAQVKAGTAELRLSPPSLGTLDVRVTLEADKAHVQFVSPHPVVREVIDAALPRLREALAQDGLSLGDVSVSDQSAERRGDSAQDETGDSPDRQLSDAQMGEVDEDPRPSGSTLSVLSGKLDCFV